MENPLNTWQNIGIMYIYALENIEQKYRSTFMVLVRYSFGYGNTKTLSRNVEFWSNKTELSKNTFVSHLKYLVQNKHIRQIKEPGFVVGGGKKPYSYAPTFPKNAKIWIRKNEEQEEFTAWGTKNDTISKTKRGMNEAIRIHKKGST